jgi:CRP/FNR family cyclic AMP-dependent transcriptional regulator
MFPECELGAAGDLAVPWLPMARRSQKLDLSSIWLFSTATPRELRLVGKALEEVSAPAGTVLVQEGTIGKEFFFIVEGRASVRRGGRKVALLGPGDYFGELALLDRAPRSATVVADTDMILLNMSQREFYGLLEDVPPLARKLLSAMAGRLRDADSKVSALISH